MGRQLTDSHPFGHLRPEWHELSGGWRSWIDLVDLELLMTNSIADVRIPDSKLAQEATQLMRDTESPLLFHHSIGDNIWDRHQ
jgi:hypothetical protein